MSQDYRLPDFHPYAPTPPLELQPPQVSSFNYSYPFQHSHQLSNTTATSTYEMTSASSGSGACASAEDPDRNTTHFDDAGTDDYEMVDMQCAGAVASAAAAAADSDADSRKRRRSCATSSAFSDYSNSSHATSCTTVSDRKQNHSEIEKRRRNRMNMYITELSSMVPMCGAMSRKLDKLSVLRMAVQHVRAVSGAQSADPLPACARPASVCDTDLNTLLLHAAQDAFLLVVGCARGRVHYVSHTVRTMLHYDQSELLGQSLFDILHPKDVAKVKEQLSSSEISPRERLIDARTMLPVKANVEAGAERLCSGARRSFFCRIKCKQPAPAPPRDHHPQPHSDNTTKKNHEKKYCVVQCTGYLKLWSGAGNEGSSESDDEQSSVSCLVAVAVARNDTVPFAPSLPPTRLLQYGSRHGIDGKFLFVDQRVLLAVGYLPQELLGTSLYEHVSGTQRGAVARAHQLALARRQPLHTPPYHFIRKDGTRALLQTHFKPFRNPWTNEVDCLVANNTIVSPWEVDVLENTNVADPPYETFAQSDVDAEVQRLIEAQVESHRIGAAIAEETYRCPQIAHPQDHIFNACFTEHMYGADEGATGGAEGAGEPAPPTPTPPLGLDGNGEAAMAVIMNMLEADAGLGEPINYSNVPWPLP